MNTTNLPDPIIAARANLLMQHPMFASHLLTQQRVDFNPETPTAKTDGKTITLGDWFNQRSLPERVFVLCHEVFHDILCHHARTRMYLARGFGPDMLPFDKKRWDRATDYYINSVLTESKIGVMPKGGLLDPRYNHTMTSDQIYELLESDPNDQDNSFDEHEPGEDSGEGVGEDEHGPTEEDISEQVRQNLVAAKAAQEASGQTMPSALAKAVGGIIEPQVDWTEQLRDFVQQLVGKDETSYARLNRRRLAIAPHIPFPGRTGHHIGSLVIAPDASGSIGPAEMSLFMAEMRAIVEAVNPTETWVLWWDTDVNAVEILEPEDIEQLTPYGGGGTDYTSIVDWLERNDLTPDVIICLTDLFVSWPDASRVRSPHLTVGTTDYDPCPFGKTIRINPNHGD